MLYTCHIRTEKLEKIITDWDDNALLAKHRVSKRRPSSFKMYKFDLTIIIIVMTIIEKRE